MGQGVESGRTNVSNVVSGPTAPAATYRVSVRRTVTVSVRRRTTVSTGVRCCFLIWMRCCEVACAPRCAANTSERIETSFFMICAPA